ncbi:MAG: hypothetical protein IKC59_08565 [Clostridia bacterium]|nr:hypothetical protein [Clostridia bacterium]
MKNKSTNRKGLSRAILALILVFSMLMSASMMCFAETQATTDEAAAAETVTGITNVSVSLNEGIVVKFYTNAGIKLAVEFNGQTTELTDDDGDFIYEFGGVTPQKMNDTITATLYDGNGETVGDVKTLTVKSYVTKLLSLDYENSGCKSTLQYEAMRELAVNMLNYGAAAQSYVGYKTDALANAELSEELKALATETIDVTETDKAVSGDAWLGAGVNFADKLGLYFVFTANSADEYAATVNGEAVTPVAYPSQGENAYVIRYNGFNATNMNDVVTAKLTKDGAEQTFAYSVRSYVYSKGGDSNALSNLINATYAYGFGAVAFTAEYEWTTEPTFENEGAYGLKETSEKGYDFTGTKYVSGTVPALNFTDYETMTEKTTTSTSKGDKKGYSYAHAVVTTFTQIKPIVNLKVVKNSDHCISLNGTLYSEYDYEKANISNERQLNYQNGAWSFDAITEQTVTDLVTYGASLTVLGTLTVNRTETWQFEQEKVTFGTADKAANVTVSGSVSPAIRLRYDSDMLVSEGSVLDIQSTAGISIYVGNGSNDEYAEQSLTVDGTLTAKGAVQTSTLLNKGLSNYEYDFKPSVFIRKGTVTCTYFRGQELQVGSERDGFSGILNLTKATVVSQTNSNGVAYLMHGQYYSYPLRYIFAKGELNMSNNGAEYRGIGILSNKEGHIDFRAGMKASLADGCYRFMHKFYREGVVNVTAHKDCFSTVADTSSFILAQTGVIFSSGYADAEMMVDGVQKTVRVVDYERIDGGSRTDEITDDQTFGEAFDILTVPENAVLTTSTTTKTIGLLGTFNQGTYVDANGNANHLLPNYRVRSDHNEEIREY